MTLKRGLHTAEAVILNTFDFSESDRIISFMTREHGRLKGIAKGARRSRKRFVNNIEPMSHSTLVFFSTEKSDLVRIDDAALINGFGGLKTDIERLSVGYYLLELTAEMTAEGQVLPQAFTLLTDFLCKIEESSAADTEMLVRFFEIRLLSQLGYMPHLEGCVACRTPLSEGPTIQFSSERGGALCRPCSTGASNLIGLSIGSARFLSMAADLGTDKLQRLKPVAECLRECEAALSNFIRFQIGKELKTRRFLDKMRSSALATHY